MAAGERPGGRSQASAGGPCPGQRDRDAQGGAEGYCVWCCWQGGPGHHQSVQWACAAEEDFHCPHHLVSYKVGSLGG